MPVGNGAKIQLQQVLKFVHWGKFGVSFFIFWVLIANPPSSYADMLSLPGYTFFDYYRAVYGRDIPSFTRPTRKDVSAYYSAYPKAAGISSAIASRTYVYHVERSEDSSGGFFVQVLDKSALEPISYTIRCKHIVLASGIFTHVLAPPKHLQILQEPSPISYNTPDETAPLLLIGTGFTAADVILSANPSRKIIHLFKWDVSRSSPLKGCHPQAYPEYANIYRQMKLAAMKSPLQYPPSLTAESQLSYEGFPNAEVISARPHPSLENIFTITISLAPGVLVTREVSNLSYFVGRRGDLTYLSLGILSEIGLTPEAAACISGDTLRQRVAENVEIEKGIFVIGSLTGDSLVKFGFGSGIYAAGSIHRTSKVVWPSHTTTSHLILDTPVSFHSSSTEPFPGELIADTVKTSTDSQSTTKCRHKNIKKASSSSACCFSNCPMSTAYIATKDSCIVA